MSNFIGQIICICQLMILIIGVMVLKAKNKITTTFCFARFHWWRGQHFKDNMVRDLSYQTPMIRPWDKGANCHGNKYSAPRKDTNYPSEYLSSVFYNNFLDKLNSKMLRYYIYVFNPQPGGKYTDDTCTWQGWNLQHLQSKPKVFRTWSHLQLSVNQYPWSIPLIKFDHYFIELTPRLTLDQHLNRHVIQQSVKSQLTFADSIECQLIRMIISTLSWLLTDCPSSINMVLIEMSNECQLRINWDNKCWLRCESHVDHRLIKSINQHSTADAFSRPDPNTRQ